MKFLMTLLAAMTAAFGSFGQVKISEYPNTNTLANTNLFVIAIKGATNMNISWGQLRFLILSDGTNTATYYASQLTNYVVANTNIATLNVTNLFVDKVEIASLTATNGTNINLYSTYGRVTGNFDVAGTNRPSYLVVTNTPFYTLSTSNIDSGAFTNFVLNVNLPEIVVYATNGLTITNFTGLETGLGTVAKYVNLRIIGCSNAMPAVTWPTFGAGAPQYSVCLYTNDARPIYTLITNANSYLYCMRWTGTNCHIVNYCSQ